MEEQDPTVLGDKRAPWQRVQRVHDWTLDEPQYVAPQVAQVAPQAEPVLIQRTVVPSLSTAPCAACERRREAQRRRRAAKRERRRAAVARGQVDEANRLRNIERKLAKVVAA